MLVIGLCGGSGSGKSTVANMLSSHNILHIDTDLIYKKIISVQSACTEELKDEFGEIIIRADGSVDRKILAQIVFSDKVKHAALNRIAHRHVLDEVRKIISESTNYFAICVDAPMLFESGFQNECDILVAVIAPIKDRINRITTRDSINDFQAEQRIHAQTSDDDLIAKVDYVINNDSDISSLEYQIDKLLEIINNKLK